MTKSVKIQDGEIEVGDTLPWTVYHDNGAVLLKKGAVVASDAQLNVILSHGCYHEFTEEPTPKNENIPTPRLDNPFTVVYPLANQLTKILNDISQYLLNSQAEIFEICEQIQKLCKEDPDAVLGIVHLCHDYPYPYIHAIHTAIVCELVTQHLEYDLDARNCILAASLTSNIAMLELQVELQKQEQPLSEEQRLNIQQHTQHGAEMLKKAGIDNTLWVDIVRQHHELDDGNGYPHGLMKEQIRKETKIVTLADQYCAMVSSRYYRAAFQAKDALRKIFLSRGSTIDEELSLVFIKVLGVYPPGSFVRLINGEIAVVTKRGKSATSPIVSSYLGPRGSVYEKPFTRDSGDTQFTIKENCTPENNVPLNLPLLWGYPE